MWWNLDLKKRPGDSGLKLSASSSFNLITSELLLTFAEIKDRHHIYSWTLEIYFKAFITHQSWRAVISQASCQRPECKALGPLNWSGIGFSGNYTEFASTQKAGSHILSSFVGCQSHFSVKNIRFEISATKRILAWKLKVLQITSMSSTKSLQL